MTVYSPPVETYIALAEIELASTASSVTLTGFSQDYRDLVLVVNGATSTSNTSIKMQFNGDTASSYSYVQMYGETGGDGSDTNTLGDIRAIMGGTSGAGMVTYNIMDFSASDKHTTVLARENNLGISWTGARASRWANTDPVTAITLTPVSGNFASATTFRLFGIEA
jgi:hypothetical protein